MRTLYQDILNAENLSLSGKDIQTILNNDVDLVAYVDFANMTDVREAFTKSNRVVILFETEARNVGHYVAMIYKQRTNTIEYFDPYGFNPGEDIAHSKWLIKNNDVRTTESLKYLLAKFKNFGGQVNVNNNRYQAMARHINTCGRHCIIRLLKHELTNTEYNIYLRGFGLTPDQIVSMLTFTIEL